MTPTPKVTAATLGGLLGALILGVVDPDTSTFINGVITAVFAFCGGWLKRDTSSPS